MPPTYPEVLQGIDEEGNDVYGYDPRDERGQRRTAQNLTNRIGKFQARVAGTRGRFNTPANIAQYQKKIEGFQNKLSQFDPNITAGLKPERNYATNTAPSLVPSGGFQTTAELNAARRGATPADIVGTRSSSPTDFRIQNVQPIGFIPSQPKSFYNMQPGRPSAPVAQNRFVPAIGGLGPSAGPSAGPSWGPAGSPTPPGLGQGGRPWYMNYDNPTLQAMLKNNPGWAQYIPAEIQAGFSRGPSAGPPGGGVQRGGPTQAQIDATFAKDRPVGFIGPGGQYAAPGTRNVSFAPGGPIAPPQFTTPGSLQPGSIAGAPRSSTEGPLQNYQDFLGAAPQRLRSVFTGQDEPRTPQTRGGIPRISAQDWAQLLPIERQALQAALLKMGMTLEDYFAQTQRLYRPSQGPGGASTAPAIARPAGY